MILLFQTTLILMLISGYNSVDVDAKLCDDGWTFYDGNCYWPHSVYESFSNADEICSVLGAKLAFANNNEALEFLTQLVGAKDVYGWWYGAKTYVRRGIQTVYLKNSIGYYNERHSIAYGNSVLMPKAKPSSAPFSNCNGYQLIQHALDLESSVVSVPCTNVKLPYICRGNGTKMTDIEHFVRNSTEDVYYFSNLNDKRNHKEAAQSCLDKHMRLASIRDMRQKDFINEQIKLRSFYHIDPWWIGLDVRDGVYSWSDGVEMQSGIVSMPTTFYRRSGINCLVLLSEGTLVNSSCIEPRAPFICVRPQLRKGQFGCPTEWLRGGQSCYYVGKRLSLRSADDGKRVCSTFDAHLISIDSQLEKNWIVESYISNRNVWVSLNDRVKPGEFVWADGSRLKATVIDWKPLKGIGLCWAYYGWSNQLMMTYCNSRGNLPGCQYVSTSGSCVSNDWIYQNGNCYYIPDNTNYLVYKPYDQMLHACYEDLAKYNSTIDVSPLKLDNQEIIDMYGKSVSIWTGLKINGRGDPEWADGTPVDMKLFSKTKQPNPGTLDKPFHCVQMDRDGYLRTGGCDVESARLVCEKEVPYPIPIHPNVGATSHSGTVMMTAICAFSVWIAKRI